MENLFIILIYNIDVTPKLKKQAIFLENFAKTIYNSSVLNKRIP